MLIGDYVRLIKRKYINRKTLSMIDDIVVYTHNCVVYRVVIRYCELLTKRLKKYGIDYHFLILDEFPKTKITDKLVYENTKCKNGEMHDTYGKGKKYENLTIIFNNHTCNSLVVSGEDKTPSLNV